MKKVVYIVAGLLLTLNAQAQETTKSVAVSAKDRPMPKPGPAPEINVGKPEEFTLKNGLKVLVVENDKLPRVSYTLTMDNAPYYEGAKKGVSDMTAALMGSGTKKMSKEAFNEEVDFLGANIGFGSQSAYASGLSKYSDRMLELMADGALNPVFTQEEFDKVKAQMIEGLKADEKSVPAVAGRVTNALVYGKNHYAGEFLTEETINNLTLADVQENYNTYFVPGNAYLVVVGNVKAKDVKKKVEKMFGDWTPNKAPNVTYNDPKDVQYTQINFVDMPNAVQSEISVVNVVNMKMTDKDYFAAILANQILGGGGEGRLFLNLREAHGWTYGAYSSLGSGKYVSDFTSSTSVRNMVTDSAVVEIFNELRRMKTELVSAEDLKNAKAKYIGSFVMNIEKPSTVATYALRTETQGLPEDFYENYIKNINAVTAEEIRSAAQRFFRPDNARIVIVGKASDVLPGLEKTGIPIFYFDKYGNPTEKPASSKPVPAGVTAKSVLGNYIKAVGGEAALKNVKTLATAATGTLQGMPIEMATKTTTGKQFVEFKMMGNSVMKQVVNDKGGYIVEQGQKRDLTGEELAEKKAGATPFEELNLVNNKDVTITGIEPINGNDAYAVKNGDTTLYYDVATGYKVAESSMAETPDGQKIPMYNYFGDYKDVKGIKIPHKFVLNVGVEIDLTINSVKINEGVTDADFQ